MLKCGIIPTRMGTSTQDRIYTTFSQDHPHAYGDKTMRCYVRRAQNGSSPRVWGQVKLIDSFGSLDRIIPTRMGTSPSAKDSGGVCRDHPHAYGDKAIVWLYSVIKVGSSPRVWGQGIDVLQTYFFDRIIPTRMGTRCLSKI